MIDSAETTYEEFRRNYEYSDGEARLQPWALLTPKEQEQWEDQWRKYTGEIDTTDGVGGVKHGDPQITDLHKPRA